MYLSQVSHLFVNQMRRQLLAEESALIGLTSPASAEVTFEWVMVRNASNAADPLNEGVIPGIGSVANEYRIAKHEVTNDQYAAFLNAVGTTDTNGLYSTNMGSDPRGGIKQSGFAPNLSYAVKLNMGNKPVTYVSFFTTMRFINWLHNGQPTGVQDSSTTEDGVYLISDGLSETRASDARFFIPTENEWYKAAYHQPMADGGDSDDFWLYGTGSNDRPTIATANDTGDITNPGINVANHAGGADWTVAAGGAPTTVGSAGLDSESFYGTSDQAGNVSEWTENTVGGSSHFLRGGAWFLNNIKSSHYYIRAPGQMMSITGFRVASPVPEDAVPTISEWGLAAMALLMLGAGTVLVRRRTGFARAA